MKIFKLDDMRKGWFIGDFSPSVAKTNQFEVGLKRYRAGDVEAPHRHTIATEITVVVSGRVLLNQREFISGDIIMIQPNEFVEFYVLEDSVTAVVKWPSIPDDKVFK